MDYALRLSEGHQALLAAHPQTLRLDVYPTRRSASYPSWVYEGIARNATQARLSTVGKGGVTNASASSPFPIPKHAVEVLWNHLLRFRGQRVGRTNGSAAITRGGRFNVILARQEFLFAFSFPVGSSIRSRFENIAFALRSRVFAPALLAGAGTLAIEPIDQTSSPRRRAPRSADWTRM